MANFINYQYRVCGWIRRCFPLAVVYDKLERGDRFLEESLELLQAADYPKERVAALVKYVYDRPKGEIPQEVGGVMVTLTALCEAHQVSLDAAAVDEITRIERPEVMERIRMKQASKPVGSALPGAYPENTDG
jgi:hypothetical protein